MMNHYFVTYFLVRNNSFTFGNVVMAFHNPAVFNIEITQNYIKSSLNIQPHAPPPVIINWKELTPDEVMVNMPPPTKRGN